MNKRDFVQFNWKKSDSQEEPLLITIDPNSSVVGDTSSDLATIFDCCKYNFKHKTNFFKTNY
jgi:hypothetical protein